MVELHEVRAVTKCLRKRARPKSTGVIALAAPYLFILTNDIQEKHFSPQSTGAAELSRWKALNPVFGSSRVCSLIKVNMKTKRTVNSLQPVKLRLSENSAPQLERDESHFSALRNMVLGAPGKLFPPVLFQILDFMLHLWQNQNLSPRVHF